MGRLGALDRFDGIQLKLLRSANDMEELAVLAQDQTPGSDGLGTGRCEMGMGFRLEKAEMELGGR